MINQKQILFFNSQKISLAVISFVGQQKYLCYFNEINLDKNVDIKTQIIKLKSMADSYLDKTINEVDLIIDNQNISKISCHDETYSNCSDENDLLMQIAKRLNKENCFVNDVIVNKCTVNSETKQTIASFDAYVLNATIIKDIYRACAQIGLKVLSTKNILNTFANNGVDSETIINFNDDSNLQVIQYVNKQINKISDIRENYYGFIALLAKKLSVSINETEKILDIANLLVKDATFDSNINILSQLGKTFYDVKKVTLASFLEQAKNTFLMYLDKQNVSLAISQNMISIYGKHQNIFNHLCKKINNYQPSFTNYIIGQEKMSLSQQICLSNLTKNLMQDQMDILRTKNIQNSFSLINTNTNDYVFKGQS